MLGKLLKYDLSALSRVLIPLHIIVIAVGAVACGAAFLGYASSEMSSMAPDALSDLADMITAFSALGLVLCVLLLFSATIATFVVILHRFYRNLFTDEGYLTLTLPVTASQQVGSKVLAGIIWLLIDGLVVFACLLAMSVAAEGFAPGTDLTDSIPVWLLGASNGDLSLYDDTFTWLTVFGWLIRSALQMLFALLMAYASFALGASIAARHKVACGIGLLIGIWFAYGMVTGTIGIAIAFFFSFSIGSTDIAMAIVSTMSICIQILMIAGFWALCVWILKCKVNLP